MTTEKKPLFELSARELDEELSAMFAPYRESHPIRCEVGSAMMAAEAATQRICLRIVAPQADAGSGGKSDDALGRLFNDFEALNGYLLEGNPSRIDLVLWDAAGFISGWGSSMIGGEPMSNGNRVRRLSPALRRCFRRSLNMTTTGDLHWSNVQPVSVRLSDSRAKRLNLKRVDACSRRAG
ncbi:hypothetical protein [Paraburkholderia sp. XV]|uniref:hypothetical protein n=1 Tax=Paraburkholderia sp. XV TaxID=2831520 RepID=UPI001CD60DD0|nr:hypothetical protein [Paraburkholderia sp. XV]